MAFLSGVLEAVKNENEVTTYDKYITPVENRLQNVINTLTKNIGSGRTGLAVSVEKVKGWLGEYNDKIRDMTFNVKNALAILQDNLSGKYLSGINSAQNLEEQLKQWNAVLEDIDFHLNETETNGVNVLDSKLKSKLLHEIKVIKKSVQVLKGSAESGDLKGQAERVDSELEWQKAQIISNINGESERLQTTLNEEFEKLLREIHRLGEINREQYGITMKVLQPAKEWVDLYNVTFEKEFKNRTIAFFQEINDSLRDVKKGEKIPHGDGMSELHRQIGGIRTAVYTIGSEMIEQVERLDKWIVNAIWAIRMALIKCDAINKKVTDRDSAERIYKTAHGLQEKSIELLRAYDKSQLGLGKLVNDAQKHVVNLDSHLKESLKTIKDDINRHIAAYFDKLYRAAFGGGSVGTIAGKLEDVAPKLRGWLEKYQGSGTAISPDSKFVQHVLSALCRDPSVNAKNYGSAYKAMEKDITDNVDKNLPDETDIQGQVATKVQIASSSFAKYKELKLKVEQAIPKFLSQGLNAYFKNPGVAEHDLAQEINLVRNQFDQITTELKSITGLVKDSSKNGGIQDHLEDLEKMINTKNGEHKLCTSHGEVYGLQNVHRELKSLYNNEFTKPGRILNAIETVLHTAGKLEILPGEVESKMQDVEKLLNQIRENFYILQCHINSIFNVAKEANKVLSTVIIEVDSAIRKSFEATRLAVSRLQSTLIEVVENAFHAVTDETRTFFAEQHMSDIQALKTLVDRQFEDIKNIIRVDRMTGIKGLMKTLNDHSDNLENIIALVKPKGSTSKDDPNTYTKSSRHFKSNLDVILHYTENQVKSYISEGERYHSKVKTITAKTDVLLDYLIYHNNDRKYIFDKISDNLLSELTSSLSTLSSSTSALDPQALPDAGRPVLKALREGMMGFVGELGKGYVSRYDGHKEKVDMSQLVDKEGKLTDNGRNLSKVFLTILEILYSDFYKLRNNYSAWNKESICKVVAKKSQSNTENIENLLGLFFADRGYKVASDGTKQDGELQRSDKMIGSKIRDLCYGKIDVSHSASKEYLKGYVEVGGKSVKLHNLLHVLHQDMLPAYYKVCHLNIRPNPTLPTTIYEMCHWLNGLFKNPIIDKLKKYMEQWFNACLKGYKIEAKDFNVALPHRRSRSMQRNLTYQEMHDVFTNATLRARDMLIAVLGHGQPDGMYACDFYTNPHNLLYPSKDSACFDLLVEVCLRVNHQIRFLYKQCHNGPSCGGWRECWYGKGVGGQRWQCNDLQCANQKGDQKHKQTCDQECNQKAECGLKSPLQSFLEDGLPGFLPHPFSKTSCTITCELPNHFGKPCLTPMGFTDLGLKASHRQTGKRIKDVLESFCGTGNESLNLFCAYMVLLLRRPPQTLCDMFTFYYNLLDHWCDDGPQKDHRQNAFNSAVAKANFGREYKQFDITGIFGSSVHDKHMSDDKCDSKGDLFSLVSCDNNANPVMPCGRYVQSIGDDIRLLYFQKHAGMYLSWIVYQAETFYYLLEKLYKEVCENCEKSGDTCFGSRCGKECEVNSTYESKESNQKSQQQNHKEDCKSIVNCSSTHQVLFKYGFTFGSPHDLSGAESALAKKRTCKDFCAALKSVLNKEKKAEAALAKLIYETIPNFLWTIREPFSYLVLALWSATFLYLLYVYIGRLDTLHIRSHLRIPASHKITAQSLLAAARIGKLAKISYLQP